MLRAIAAVIVGYLTLFAIVFVGLTVAYLAMGSEKAFKPGSFDASTLWLITMLVVGLVAAVVGGLVCASISRAPGAVVGLAMLVVVLGLAMAVPVLADDSEAAPRTGEVAMFDAMSQAKQPGWVALINPFIGVVGVVLGARLRRGGRTRP
jgi:hypothetical protein